ncbi:TetR/AcrR family transcriptional regulator [Corynebacterium lowii]|uniref:Tetracycline repressor protein class H n=1 Tax=Corynebacterium lowii TaxID=1544413 RepID=A0A0Q0UIW1_9CORY|nr:TetR/AcrR family transcriptional regulator C-terminal domain-containing protein [Corynebacterium lowii]KQB86175.1 Tetracycline repressor protein class H [Corynebacterium lowii]MDP9852649.1 AcrR family transcriptional regulator [Corynebacterium lowii]
MSTQRKGPGRPPVPQEKILLTALEIIDEQGAEALSLRNLADRLSSSTSTLYRRVSGRGELLGMVIEHLLGQALEQAQPSAELPWEEACRGVLTAIFETFYQHRHAARLLIDTIPTGHKGMALRELLLDILLRAGFPPDYAAYAMATLARYTIGFAMQMPTAQEDSAAAGTTLREVDPAAFPRIAATARMLPLPLDREFHTGLDLLLKGLRADLAAQ